MIRDNLSLLSLSQDVDDRDFVVDVHLDVGIRVSCRRDFGDGSSTKVQVELEDEHDDSTPVSRGGGNGITGRKGGGGGDDAEEKETVNDEAEGQTTWPSGNTNHPLDDLSESHSEIRCQRANQDNQSVAPFDASAMELTDVSLAGSIGKSSFEGSASVEEEMLRCRRRSYDSMVERIMRGDDDIHFEAPVFDFESELEVHLVMT